MASEQRAHMQRLFRATDAASEIVDNLPLYCSLAYLVRGHCRVIERQSLSHTNGVNEPPEFSGV